MGKFAKVCLITATIMICLGLFVGTIVTVLGGGNLIRGIAREGIVHIGPRGINFWDWNWSWNWGRGNSWSRYWDGGIDLKVNGTRIADKSYTSDFNFGEINSLNLTVGVGQFDIIPWEKDSFGIRITGMGACRYYNRGSTLHVEGFDFSGWNTTNINTRNNRISLYVPESIYYDELRIEVGVGSLDIRGLTVNRLRSEAGVGSVTMKDMVVERLYMNNSVGESIFGGEVRGNIAVDNGIGSTVLRIRGHEDDFDYEISCSIGSITVGRQSYSGLAHARTINNNAAKDMKLNCAIGSIEVSFY